MTPEPRSERQIHKSHWAACLGATFHGYSSSAAHGVGGLNISTFRGCRESSAHFPTSPPPRRCLSPRAFGSPSVVASRRTPKIQVWTRAFCYVLFVSWALMLLGVIGIVATREEGRPIFAAMEAAAFFVIAMGLGVGDIWAAHRGPRETVEWRPEQAMFVKRAFNQTASAGALGTTLAYRYSKGRSMIKLRVPIGPRGKLRLVALRSEPHTIEALEWVLAGAPSFDD
jgi:hypothetical protein